ncbi:MAG: hypothetical protein M3Y56_08930 [Armatimonadota bacterium]|nr:hypothetical protein [Armatimonadota bacterium]
MVNHQYVWLFWASAFLIPWIVLFSLFPRYRRVMCWASILTSPFGLTEPLFVPSYWNPPSLFHLAQTTRFDLESLIFTFAIGGVGAVLYNGLTHQTLRPMAQAERKREHHRLHRTVLLFPFLVFSLLYFLPWNVIYPGVIAMAAGAAGTMLCRPDLKVKTLIGGVLFLSLYFLFMLVQIGRKFTGSSLCSRPTSIACITTASFTSAMY